MFVMSISFSEAPGPLTVLHAHVVVHLIIFGQHVCVQPGHKGCHNSVLGGGTGDRTVLSQADGVRGVM